MASWASKFKYDVEVQILSFVFVYLLCGKANYIYVGEGNKEWKKGKTKLVTIHQQQLGEYPAQLLLLVFSLSVDLFYFSLLILRYVNSFECECETCVKDHDGNIFQYFIRLLLYDWTVAAALTQRRNAAPHDVAATAKKQGSKFTRGQTRPTTAHLSCA